MIELVESKIEALIEVASRIETLEEDSGNTNADGSTDRNPGLTDSVRERIEAAGKKAKEAGEIQDAPEIDTESPSHMASILNKVGQAAEEIQ